MAILYIIRVRIKAKHLLGLPAGTQPWLPRVRISKTKTKFADEDESETFAPSFELPGFGGLSGLCTFVTSSLREQWPTITVCIWSLVGARITGLSTP